MAAKTLCRPDPNAFASESGAGTALPLLPTLVVAAVVGALALCREPVPTPVAPDHQPTAGAMAAQEAQEAAPIVIGPYQVGLDRAGRLAAADGLPGSIAFARHFPVIADGSAERVAPARVARAAHPRPDCTGGRCAETTRALAASPRPMPPVRTAVHATAPVDAEPETGMLPDVALPFAPTIRVVNQAVGFVGHRASAAGTDALALCDAVTGFVGGLR